MQRYEVWAQCIAPLRLLGGRLRLLFYVFALMLLIGCGGQAEGPAPTAVESNGNNGGNGGVVLPTLVPTFTPAPDNNAPPSPTPLPQTETDQAPPPTPVDLTQDLLTLRLTIPAIEYDREMRGDLAGSVTVIDHAAGREILLTGRGRLLAEVQGALINAVANEQIVTTPADCDRCAQISATLPAEGLSADGWLLDGILLASIEFFFANELGAHFPPGTVVGIHRSASGYNVGHFAAITDQGEFWSWMSPEVEIPEPTDLSAEQQAVLDEVVGNDALSRAESAYVADCTLYPAETLIIGEKTIILKCPPLALPAPLVDLYAAVDGLTAAILADERNLPLPDELLPLDSVIAYARPDGAYVQLYPDGRMVATALDGTTAELEISAEVIDAYVIAFTQSDVIPRGVSVLTDATQNGTFEEVLLVRGELGVYELVWADKIGQQILPPILELEALLSQMIGEPEAAAPTTLDITIDATTNLMGTRAGTPLWIPSLSDSP